MRMGTAHPDKSFEMLWASSAPILKLAQVTKAQARYREPAPAQAPSRSASRCTYDDPRIDNEEDQAPHQPEIRPGLHRE